MSKLLSVTAGLFLAAMSCIAGPVTITSYDITDAMVSGFGSWAHTYSGTITPTGPTVEGRAVADYSGGSGTLNDGVVGTTVSATQLFWQSLSQQNTPVAPVITLFLPGLYTINSISLFGGPESNAIPGCFTGVTVGIGGSSEAIATSAFGPIGCGVPINDLATITGTSLQGIATTSITLSNFTGPLFQSGYFSITEIRIDGDLVSAVPEPATIGLIGCGLLGVLLARLRRKSPITG